LLTENNFRIMNYTEDQIDYYVTDLDTMHEIISESIEVSFEIYKNLEKYTTDRALFHYLNDIECSTDDDGNGIRRQVFYNDDEDFTKYIDVEIRHENDDPVEIVSHEEIYFD